MRMTRRRFVRTTLGGGVVGAGLLLVGWRSGLAAPRVDRHEVPLAGLPDALDGFRILLVSDVHAGAGMDESRMAGVARLVNGLGAELVVVAGDMIDQGASESDVSAFARTFGRLRAPCGVVAVPGNHEHYAGIDRSMTVLRESGFRVLSGSHVEVGDPGSELVVLGVDDPIITTFDPPQDEAVAAVAARAPQGPVRVLVSHRPAAFDAAERHGIALTLSGHTHGGQIGLPLRDLTPTRLVTRYVRGHYERRGCHLVVSSGVGTGGFPIRVGVPPSVALVTLRRSESALRTAT